jgi:hypothetical protein
VRFIGRWPEKGKVVKDGRWVREGGEGKGTGREVR